MRIFDKEEDLRSRYGDSVVPAEDLSGKAEGLSGKADGLSGKAESLSGKAESLSGMPVSGKSDKSDRSDRSGWDERPVGVQAANGVMPANASVVPVGAGVTNARAVPANASAGGAVAGAGGAVQGGALPPMPTRDYVDYYKEVEDLGGDGSVDIDAVMKALNEGGKPTLGILQEYFKPPKPKLDEREERRARNSALIADSLVTLAELAGYGIGSDVRNRDFKGASERLKEELDKDADRMDKERQRYDELMSKGALDDFKLYLDNARSGAAGKRELAKLRAGEKKANDDMNFGIRYENWKHDRDKRDKDAEYERAKKDEAARARRDFGYQMALRSMSSEGNRSGAGDKSGGVRRAANGNYIISVGSNEHDKYARESNFGYVHDYPLTPSEYDMYLRQASDLFNQKEKRRLTQSDIDNNTSYTGQKPGAVVDVDNEFVQEYPQLKALGTKGGGVNGTYNFSDIEKDALVWCYVDWLHKKSGVMDKKGNDVDFSGLNN